jgi:hypothetical protein
MLFNPNKSTLMRFFMKKILCFCVLSMFVSGIAQGDIIFSTSSTNPFAGTTLNLANVGSTGSMYVYFSTEQGRVLQGTSFNIDSSDINILQATAHLVENPGSARWQSINPGVLGDLVVDTRAVALFPPFGLGTNGMNDFVLYSEVRFNATAEGVTQLSFSRGPLGLSYRDVPGDQWDNFVKGTATVIVAIPEPTGFTVLAISALNGLLMRRRRMV